MASTAKSAAPKTTVEKKVRKKAPQEAQAVEKSEKTAAVTKPRSSRVRKESPSEEGARVSVSPEQKRHYIEVAAYYIAERKGFCGDPLQDWVEAEAEIERLIAEGKLGA
ncbi:MAG: DUF2934 domain-containing protein [Rhodocyclaceae bacterium]|nr:DUF2934 domain-containing protein [Rhodocyclaceae bacterium]